MDKFSSTVVSYPDRGVYGQSSYRGNTTGHIVLQFLKTWHTKPEGLFVDPMQGGKTSADVAKYMGIRYAGFDLREGFNILKDDLSSLLPVPAHTAFVHPPYMNMIDYGGGENDLSSVCNFGEFLEKCQLALMNIYKVLEPGGVYAVLMGNMRKAGVFYPIASRLALFSPGEQIVEIIKQQNNMSSNRKMNFYGNNFVPTTHEILSVFKKPESMLFALDVVLSKEQCVARLGEGTWRNVIRLAMMGKNEMSLGEIYAEVGKSPKAKKNPFWQEKVRQIVQTCEEFTRVDRGVYQLAFGQA